MFHTLRSLLAILTQSRAFWKLGTQGGIRTHNIQCLKLTPLPIGLLGQFNNQGGCQFLHSGKAIKIQDSTHGDDH